MNRTSKKAVAIKYDKSNPVPFVVSKGSGTTAELILKKASQNGIQIVENEVLTDRLYELDVLQIIPEETFEVVAKILAYVYNIEKEYEKDTGKYL